ncbi:hypothetical protein JCM10914A_03060 [Paenibacillus sp. JCM 10914]
MFAQLTLLCVPTCDNVRHNGLVRRHIVTDNHGRLPYKRMTKQRRLDLPKLDPVAPDFYLLIDPSQVFQVPILLPAHQVSRPVKALVPLRMNDELLRRQLRTIPIPTRQPGAADV